MRIRQVFNSLSVKQRWFLGLAFGVSIAAQLLLPSDMILPRTSLDGVPVGLQDKTMLSRRLAEEGQSLKLVLGNETKKVPIKQAGLSLDIERTIAQLPSFSWKERITPLAAFIKIARGSQENTVVIRNTQKIRQFAKDLAKKEHKEPLNAEVKIHAARLILTDAQPGHRYDARDIQKALAGSQIFSGKPVVVEGDTLPAEVTKSQLKPLQTQFSRITAQPLKVKYGDTVKEVDSKTVSSWLSATRQEAGWQLTLNPAAVKSAIDTWSKEYNLPSGTTQVSMVDDREVGRVNGEAGRALSPDVINQQLGQWIQEPGAEVIELASVAVPPKVVVTRTYSRDSAQLQAKLDAWIAAHSGRYQVAIRELGGRGREASHNVSEQTVMASTYKTFLAFAAYRQAEAGVLNLSGLLVHGKNIEQCIDVMIVVSDNDCAIALGRHIGWAQVDQIIAASGFQSVKLNNYDSAGNFNGDKLVNAKEQANFLAQLSAGSLINSGNTDKLMNYMKRQVYRRGIPAGSRGAVVADKVGFLDNYLHDVGVVYGQKSTYALVIMSEGSSWENIRSLAQAIYDFMNE